MSSNSGSKEKKASSSLASKGKTAIDIETFGGEEPSVVGAFDVEGDELELNLSTSKSDPQWDAFLKRTGAGHHLQTSLWAQAKAMLKWEAVRIIATTNQRIAGGAQILYRSVIPRVRVAYITKGPVVDRGHPELVKVILQKSIEVCRSLHARVVVVQPPNTDQSLVSLLPELGFDRTSLELAPSASVLIDLSRPIEEILNEMKRQTRQNIRRSEREGIVIREGEEKDIELFYRFHLTTSKRQGFVPYPKEYFTQMWQVFRPSDSIKLFIAEYLNDPVSALLVIPFGDTAVPKIFGWSGRYPEKRPNEAVFWGAMLWAKTHGYGLFDLEGIDRDGASAVLRGDPLPEPLHHSPDFFKIGFGGKIVLYPEAYRKVSGRMLRWICRTADPKLGSDNIPSRIVDYLRKR